MLENKSIKLRIIAASFVLLSLFGGILFVQYNNSLAGQKNGIVKNFMGNSDKLASSISQSFFYYYHNVQAIAKNEVFTTTDSGKINKVLNDMVSLYPIYDYIIVTNLEGEVLGVNTVSSSGKKLKSDAVIGSKVSDLPWFKESKDGIFTEDFDKNIFGSRFGQLKKSKVGNTLYGEDIEGWHISTPIQNETGSTVGIISTFVDKKWLVSEIDLLLSSLLKEGETSDLYNISVVDSELKIIASNNKDVSIGTLKTNLSKEIQDKKTLVSFTEKDDSYIRTLKVLENSRFVSSIGWVASIETKSEAAFSSINNSKNIFYLSFVVALFFCGVLSYFLSNGLANKMIRISQEVEKGANEVSVETEEITEQANLLNNLTNEQAASLQETVSSLNEISAMVDKNNDHAKRSKHLSGLSREKATTGMKTMESLTEAVSEIGNTNNDIVKQISLNIDELGKVINIIKDIEEKTNLVNEIVFQTKLLSFNASVEAARAGEHGKGFSVVAEEIGALAKNSGDASQQIEELLSQSLSAVDGMVQETKIKFEPLIKRVEEKISIGNKISSDCREILEEIVSQSGDLDNAIEEISNASNEQNMGIKEISSAMAMLDEVTRKNSEISTALSEGTKSLSQSVSNLERQSVSLGHLVFGNNDFQKKTLEDNILSFPNKENDHFDQPFDKKAA